MFPLQSGFTFMSDTRSPVLSHKSFVCTTSDPSDACLSPATAITVLNCKNIHNCSVSSNSVSLSSSNVESIRKPAYPVVSSSDIIINISRSHSKSTPTNSNSIDFSTFCVVSHQNIHYKCKLCV